MRTSARQTGRQAHSRELQGGVAQRPPWPTPLHPGSSGASEASSEVGSIVAAGLSGAGRALAADTRRTFEQGFGRDFSRVRIHADREADAAAHALGTTAFALGADVAFAAGRYEPHTARGRHVLAHELAHVAQSSAAGAAGVVRRLPPPGPAADEPPAPAAPAPAPAPAEAAAPAPAPAAFAIEASVGTGGVNHPADVARVQARLVEIGLLPAGDAANEAPFPAAAPAPGPVEGDPAAAPAEAADVSAEELAATIQAIVDLQTLLFTRGRPDGLINAEPDRPTLKALGTLDAAGVAELRAAYEARQQAAAQAKERKDAAATEKAEAEAQAAYERSPAAAAARLEEARTLVRVFGWFVPGTDQYVSIEEKALGARLATEAPAKPKVVLAALDQLYAGDRQQVVVAMATAMDDATLGTLDTDLAVRIHAEAGSSPEGMALRGRLLGATLGMKVPGGPLAAEVTADQWVTDQYWTGAGDVEGQAAVLRRLQDDAR